VLDYVTELTRDKKVDPKTFARLTASRDRRKRYRRILRANAWCRHFPPHGGLTSTILWYGCRQPQAG
jgi:hypothetical protein